jgi:hypothetical protein
MLRSSLDPLGLTTSLDTLGGEKTMSSSPAETDTFHWSKNF